jgi:integrase
LIAEGALNGSMINPVEAKPIVREIKELRALREKARSRDGRRVVTSMQADEAAILCGGMHPKVPAARQVRYAVAIGTGLRDNELQALTWADLHLDDVVPFIAVTKQLLKPGIKPPLRFETEREQGRARNEIMSSPRAVHADPKYGRTRRVPLHPGVVVTLRWWHQTGWKQSVGANPAHDDPIFPRDKKSPIPGIFAHSQSAPLLRQDLMYLGLSTEVHGKPLVFHSLRHTNGLALEGGRRSPRRHRRTARSRQRERDPRPLRRLAAGNAPRSRLQAPGRAARRTRRCGRRALACVTSRRSCPKSLI